MKSSDVSGQLSIVQFLLPIRHLADFERTVMHLPLLTARFDQRQLRAKTPTEPEFSQKPHCDALALSLDLHRVASRLAESAVWRARAGRLKY